MPLYKPPPPSLVRKRLSRVAHDVPRGTKFASKNDGRAETSAYNRSIALCSGLQTNRAARRNAHKRNRISHPGGYSAAAIPRPFPQHESATTGGAQIPTLDFLLSGTSISNTYQASPILRLCSYQDASPRELPARKQLSEPGPILPRQ